MLGDQKFNLTLFIIFSLLIFSTAVQAEKNLIFSRIDPANDDYGPGYYHYPQHKIFNMKKGLFDITDFKIYEENYYYEIQLKFTDLVDVWNSRYGFSMPLIEIYIDNQEGGSTRLFEKGANVKLNPKFPWNRLVKINGWWISIYKPEDRNKQVVDFSVSGEDVPWVIKNPGIEVQDNWIKLKIEKEKIGSLKNANLFIMVGGFDPFGYGHFRGVKDEINSWFFASEGDLNIENAPRVIDIIIPPEYNQSEMLSNYQNGLAQIEPVYVGNDNELERYRYYCYLIIFIILTAIVYFSRKFFKRKTGVKKDEDEKEEQTGSD